MSAEATPAKSKMNISKTSHLSILIIPKHLIINTTQPRTIVTKSTDSSLQIHRSMSTTVPTKTMVEKDQLVLVLILRQTTATIIITITFRLRKVSTWRLTGSSQTATDVQAKQLQRGQNMTWRLKRIFLGRWWVFQTLHWILILKMARHSLHLTS